VSTVFAIKQGEKSASEDDKDVETGGKPHQLPGNDSQETLGYQSIKQKA
jgi:hypothetical protein